MAQTDLLARLADARNAQFSANSQQVRNAARKMWLGAGSWRDADTLALSKRLGPLVAATQLHVAGGESAYLARQMAIRRRVAVAPAPVARLEILASIDDPIERFQQPAIALYSAIAAGELFSAGLESSLAQLDGIIRESLTQARDLQQKSSFKHSKITHFRRTLGAKACDFCVGVIGPGDARYLTEDLAPLHNRCDCGVDPE